MDHKEAHHLRLYVLAALFFIVAAVYIGVLYDTQVNNYDYYYASSVRSIARSETVEAARGNITDRNGKVLVSSRSSYNLTFDASLLEKDEDANESLLRLLQLCQSRGINWVDSLPISRSAPFAYTIDSLDSAARSRFLTYLKDLDEAANALAAYLLEHPALLETTDEEGNRENPADDILADEELDQAGKAQALLEELTSSQLTGAMLEGSGLSATRLIALMRKDFGLSASFSVEEAGWCWASQYEIRSRNLAQNGRLCAGGGYRRGADLPAERRRLRRSPRSPPPPCGSTRRPTGRISWGISEKSTTVRKRRPWARDITGTTMWARTAWRRPLNPISRAPTAPGWSP